MAWTETTVGRLKITVGMSAQIALTKPDFQQSMLAPQAYNVHGQ